MNKKETEAQKENRRACAETNPGRPRAAVRGNRRFFFACFTVLQNQSIFKGPVMPIANNNR
jgi:hypothetical protein